MTTVSIAKLMESCESWLPAPRQTLLVSPGWKRQMLAKMASESASPVTGVEHMATRYLGMPFEVADIPPERVEDWSGCRSPARAKRRAKQGYPQRVTVTYRERAFLVDDRVLAGMRGFAGRLDRMMVKALFDSVSGQCPPGNSGHREE